MFDGFEYEGRTMQVREDRPGGGGPGGFRGAPRGGFRGGMGGRLRRLGKLHAKDELNFLSTLM